MNWKRMLAYITGSVDEELLLRNEYLAGIAKKLGKKALAEIATIATPQTLLAWHKKLVARKFDGSKKRRKPVGWPRTPKNIEDLVLKLARENRSWGCSRIVGVMKNLGHQIGETVVADILRRHGISPAPERKKGTTWKEFIRSHMEVMSAADFFTRQAWTLHGLTVGSRAGAVGL